MWGNHHPTPKKTVRPCHNSPSKESSYHIVDKARNIKQTIEVNFDSGGFERLRTKNRLS